MNYEDLMMLALANKIAAEKGIEECGMILAKIGMIDREAASKEIIAEIDEAHEGILERQSRLRDILSESNKELHRLQAMTN